MALEKIVTKALAILSARGVKGTEARETLLTIGASRFLALDVYARKVRAAKAGKKVSFEHRHAIKYQKPARKPARKPAERAAKVAAPAASAST